ncbi:hypothetical protein IJJ18_00020 [Candidatus Saccharibacteria bacterium]|nr:hypothetical protein [Candidatus Saccharibacteria bacterium]
MPSKKEKSGEKGPAISKRIKISKAQQTILLIVLGAAVGVGICLSMSIHFVKYISFNGKVINAKNKAISNYETTLKNVETLKTNILEDMANNPDLESVARQSQSDCRTSSGKKIDYRKKYEEEQDEDKKAYYLDMVKMCSSLRVIPDALPAKQNVEALLASLNQIFIESDWDPESLAPSENDEESLVEGVVPIPVTLSVESDSKKTLTVLNNIERSIRTFDITSATVEWSGKDKLSLQANAIAYYLEQTGIKETTETVYASKDAKKASSGGSK